MAPSQQVKLIALIQRELTRAIFLLGVLVLEWEIEVSFPFQIVHAVYKRCIIIYPIVGGYL